MRVVACAVLLAACGPSSRPATSGADAAGGDVAVPGDGMTCAIPRGSLDLQNDDHNCGAVCHDCTVCGGTCVAGHCTPETLVADTSATAALAVDATRVYWVDSGSYVPGSSRVLAMDKRGGPVHTLVEGETKTCGVAVDASFVYWTNSTSSTSAGSVKKMPLAGGAAAVIDAMPTYNPAWIAAGTTGVYWYGSGVSGLFSDSGTETPREVAEPDVWGYAGGSGLAYYLHYDPTGATTSPVELRSSPDHGGAYTVLASTASRDWAFLAAGHDGIYMTTDTAGDVLRVPFAGGSPVVVASNQAMPFWIVGDDRAVYWTDLGTTTTNGKLVKLVPGGQPEEVLTIGLPQQLAIDDSCVYFNVITVNSFPYRGSLLRVAR